MKTRTEPKSKSEMYPKIEQWQKSQQAQKQWCENNNVTPHVFHYWLRKYRTEHEDTKQKFIPLQISEPCIQAGQIEIHYPNGVQLRVGSQIPLTELRKLIQIV